MGKTRRAARWTVWWLVVPIVVATLAILRMRWAERPGADAAPGSTGSCDGTCDWAHAWLGIVMFGWPVFVLIWIAGLITILIRRPR